MLGEYVQEFLQVDIQGLEALLSCVRPRQLDKLKLLEINRVIQVVVVPH